MTPKFLRWIAPCVCILLSSPSHAQPLPVASVKDAIEMTRIQNSVAPDGSVAAISPDGRSAAAVTWTGDVGRNLNVYTLKLFDLTQPSLHKPVDVLSWDFVGDAEDQNASPFSQLVFLADNRTLAFLGRKGDAAAQVFTVDTVTKKLRQLTDHSTTVRSFVVGPDGRLRAFSAVASVSEGQKKARLAEDGVFMWNPDLFPFRFEFNAAFPILWNKGDRQVRQYFLAASKQAAPFFDSRRSRPAAPLDLSDPDVANSPRDSLEDESGLSGWATLTGDPTGRALLLFPYGLTEHEMHPERYAYYANSNAYSRRVAAPYGVVDARTGRIERLIDAPSPQFDRPGSGPSLWTPDGRSVIVYSLFPDAPAERPQWAEVDIATRKMTPIGLPKEWRPIGWTGDGKALVLIGNGGRFGTLPRLSGKGWGAPAEAGIAEGLNGTWRAATNGHVAIGVRDTPTSAPELVTYDFASGRTTQLSDFNPQLRQRRYGEVQAFRWESEYEKDASGFLIKPVDYEPGRRYPLVIMLDDGSLGRDKTPYLLDGASQLSGHAAQMLATQGFMVLYPREPVWHGIMGTAEEGEHMRAHIESAVATLNREGLIDPQRIGLSGWSRAAYHTDYLLIHSSIAFAAASAIDGGATEYTEGMRPFTDEELKRIRTPKLFEPHGVSSLVSMGSMADRMTALGRPAEILYFDTASHSTTRPQHRLRSLSTNIDWWRFWLKGDEDENPAKAEQYAHWHKLRERQTRR